MESAWESRDKQNQTYLTCWYEHEIVSTKPKNNRTKTLWICSTEDEHNPDMDNRAGQWLSEELCVLHSGQAYTQMF